VVNFLTSLVLDDVSIEERLILKAMDTVSLTSILNDGDIDVESVVFTGIVASALVMLTIMAMSLFRSVPARDFVPVSALTTKSKKTERTKVVCPFSKDTNFVVESAEHLEPSPLDKFEEWVEAESGLPLGARWLNAGLSGQDTPGMLRAGLRRLRNSRHFLVEEPHRIGPELLLKKKALDNPARHPIVYVAEPGSLDAQVELLELFTSYLPVRYPNLYTYDSNAKTIYCKPIDETFSIDDWKHAPLELCERIVQEDLILMRVDETSTTTSNTGMAIKDKSYVMAAAAVVFSFNELQEKLGKPAEFIHAPVPGFEKHLRRTLNMTFNKLRPEAPMWRNNWGVAPSGILDDPLYGSSAAHEHRKLTNVTVEEVKSKFLKVEYQTIRRLPKTGYLLFTVKTMADPMYALEKLPLASSCLAASIRGMSPAMRKYKGIEDDMTCQAVLQYLDSIEEMHRQ
jgi:hypothetical protein